MRFYHDVLIRHDQKLDIFSTLKLKANLMVYIFNPRGLFIVSKTYTGIHNAYNDRQYLHNVFQSEEHMFHSLQLL